MDGTAEGGRQRRQMREGYGWALAAAGVLLVVFAAFVGYRRSRPKPDQPPTPAGEPSVTAMPFVADRIEASPGALGDFNVLLVSMDTTRADHLGCYGHRTVATPVIDALAREGTLFTTAVTLSPSTLPAHCSLMTGLYPHRHGARANGTFRLEDEVTTLAEVLAAAGYRTAAAVSAFVLDSRFGLNQGFEFYEDDLSKGIRYSPHMFRERAAELTNERAGAWLREHGREKFFLWVHYFDPHAAYLPPEPFRSIYAGNLYDGEIAYTDAQIGALLSVLDELGVREKTLIVLTADHGEGLGDHGEQTHSLLVYDSTLHVPLIFHAPSRLPTGRVVRRQVCLVDVMPTVLSLLGQPVPADLDGWDLCAPPRHEPRSVYIETIATMTLHGWAPLLGVRRDDYKFIFAPKPELYDLVSDPKELLNLHDEREDVVGELSRQLDAMIGGDPFLVARGVAPNLVLDEATRDSLASLGYITTVTDSAGATGPLSHDPKDMIHQWEKVQEAINLRAQGKLNEAIPILENCVHAVEGDIFARQVLASSYQVRGEYEKSLAVSRRSAELEPHDERIALGVGAAFLALGRLKEAEAAARRALEIEPEFAQAFTFLGQLAMRRGDEQQAREQFEKAIAMDPGGAGPQAYCDLGLMDLLAGRLDSAREAFNRAIELDAFDATAHDGLANVLIEEKRYDDAERELSIALKFDPNLPRVLATLAWLKLERGLSNEAMDLCQRAIDIAPKCPQAHNVLGLAHRRRDEYELAEASYLAAIEYGPYLDAPYVNLAQLRLKQGRVAEAMAQFESAARANPYCKIALVNLGSQHFNEGRVDVALDFYQRALAVDADYALAHRNIVSAFAVRDDPVRAAYHLRRFLELEPDDPDADEMRAALARAEREAAARGLTDDGAESPSPSPDGR